MSSFDATVCAPVRAHLGRNVRLPSLGTWDVSTQSGAPLLSLELPHTLLGEHLQPKGPATPFVLMCFSWWPSRLPRPSPALRPPVRTQLAPELDVIEQAGLAESFLVVWDIVRFARAQGIRCQGRGSAANSLVAYLLGITRIVPLAHNLLF